MTFAVVAKPSTEACAITRFGIGLCYTLCYAALVAKTNRIHRIFNSTINNPHKPRYVFLKEIMNGFRHLISLTFHIGICFVRCEATLLFF